MVNLPFLQTNAAEYLPTDNSVIARRLARLEIQLADWRIRDPVLVTGEIVSRSGAAVSRKGARRTAKKNTYDVTGTYDHHSVVVRTG